MVSIFRPMWWFAATASLAGGLPLLSTCLVAGEAVRYEGPITHVKNRQLFQRVEDEGVGRLVMTSGGGDVAAGIELGRWVFRNGLDIEVNDHCFSSCANYVFPAGRNKVIHPGGVVAWHGSYRHLEATGLWREEIPVRMKKYNETREVAERQLEAQVLHLASIEQRFFEEIGVDPYLCWIGKMPPFEVPNYYFLSEQDMAQFGVDNVSLPEDYPQTDVSRFSVHITYIDLSVAAH